MLLVAVSTTTTLFLFDFTYVADYRLPNISTFPVRNVYLDRVALAVLHVFSISYLFLRGKSPCASSTLVPTSFPPALTNIFGTLSETSIFISPRLPFCSVGVLSILFFEVSPYILHLSKIFTYLIIRRKTFASCLTT